MDHTKQQILSRLTQYLIDNPTIRFGQALGNLKINEWANPLNPGSENYRLRDIHSDEDKDILNRMTK